MECKVIRLTQVMVINLSVTHRVEVRLDAFMVLMMIPHNEA